MILAVDRCVSIRPPATNLHRQLPAERMVDIERSHILAVLESSGWRIRGAGAAAERLGLKPTTLETRLVKLGIRRPTP